MSRYVLDAVVYSGCCCCAFIISPHCLPLVRVPCARCSVVVNAAYLVDSVLAETEQGRALREIKQLDAGFDEYTFISHMRDEYIPMISRAFFKLDMPVLRAHCKETALAQMRAVQAARDLEGLTHDGMILQVSRVELLQARSLERGVPIVLVTAQVQYIHCVRNKMVSGTI